MHPEVISIRYFWYRFGIAAVGLAGFFICMTSGIMISSSNSEKKDIERNVTGWGRTNKDWSNMVSGAKLRFFPTPSSFPYWKLLQS